MYVCTHAQFSNAIHIFFAFDNAYKCLNQTKQAIPEINLEYATIFSVSVQFFKNEVLIRK
jgi:hypothetical protein